YKNGEEQIKTEDDDNIYYSFKLTEEDVENEMINIVTSYEVPFMNFVHENVDFRFQITGLDDIPVKDNEEIEDEEDSDSGDENESTDEEQGNDEDEGTDEEQGADEDEGTDEEQGADEDEGTDEEQGAEEDEGTDEEQGADEEEGTDEEQGEEEDEGTDEEQGADEDEGTDEEQGADKDEGTDKGQGTDENKGNDKDSEVTEYDIIIKALHADKDEPSAAADYINEQAKVSIKDGKYILTITVPKDDQFSLYGMQIDGATETKEEDENNIYFIFELEELNEMLYAQTQYEVPAFNLDHDVDFRIQIVEGLDQILDYDEGNNGSNGNDEKDKKDEKDEQDGNNEENGKKENDVKEKTTDGNKEEDDSIEKPAFGSNDDHGEGGGSKIGGKQTNPQTGDYSSIILYGLLLIGSSLFLTFQIKRRFV